MNDASFGELHDATLVRIDVNSATRTVRIYASPVGPPGPAICLEFVGFSRLLVPCAQPWGPSVSINSASILGSPGAVHVEIELQSGDVITCDCQEVGFSASSTRSTTRPLANSMAANSSTPGFQTDSSKPSPAAEVRIRRPESGALEDDELQEIDARCQAATAGPWLSFVERRDRESGSDFIRTPGADIELLGATRGDQEFIAHARQDIPALLAEVSRLRSRLRESTDSKARDARGDA
jgi:hypothetical protein